MNIRPFIGLLLSFPFVMAVFWLVFAWNALAWAASLLEVVSSYIAVVFMIATATAPFLHRRWRRYIWLSNTRLMVKLALILVAGAINLGVLIIVAHVFNVLHDRNQHAVLYKIVSNFLRFEFAGILLASKSPDVVLSNFDFASAIVGHPGLETVWGIVVASILNGIATSRLRRFAASHSRIVVFRPFDPSVAAYLRRKLLPILGSYGRLDVLHDDVLGMGLLEEFYGIDLNTQFFDPTESRKVKDSQWQSVLPNLICGADIVVFDLSLLSANLLRELEACAQFSNATNVLFIANIDVPVDWAGLGQRFPEFVSGGQGLLAPVRYGRWNLAFRFRLFIWCLTRSWQRRTHST